jgi:TRAP transporter 4TM/12TM fusion protein
MQQRALHVLFGFTLTLILFSPTKRAQPATNVPILDILLIFLTTACCINTYIKFEWFHIHLGESTTLDLFLGVTIIILALETGRRVIGWVFPLLTVAFLLYAFLGPYFPGMFRHPGFDPIYVIQTLNQTTLGVWGFVTGISATILAMFIIFGAFLLFTGGGQAFVDIAIRVAGKYRGGPALVSVASSALFGTISGSAVANVVVDGVYNIPLMIRLGYRPEFAGGVEATTSTGGQIMPPIMGAGAFIMAEILGISYLEVAWAAFIPACLYFISVLAAIRLEALKRDLPAIPAEEIPSWHRILTWRRMAPLFIPIVVLLGMLGKGYTPTTAGFWACAIALLLFTLSDLSLPLIKHRVGMIIGGLEQAGMALVEIVSLLVCANIVIGLINLTGVGVKLSELILTGAGSSLFLALIAGAMVAIILGMGIPTTAAYLIAAAVIAPALAKMGLIPLAGHLFLFYYACLSAITPPVCVAVYAAAAIAKTSWLGTAAVSLRLALIAFLVPFIFIYEPALIMIGKPLEILLRLFLAILATIFIGAGLVGYLTKKLGMPIRVPLLLAGLMLFVPYWQINLLAIAIIVFTLIGGRLIRAEPAWEKGSAKSVDPSEINHKK